MQYFSNSKPMLIDNDFKKGIEHNFIKHNNIIKNKNDSNLLTDIINSLFFFFKMRMYYHIYYLL